MTDPTGAPEVAGRVPRLSDEARRLIDNYGTDCVCQETDVIPISERALSAYIAGLEAELALVAAADRHAAHVEASSGTYSVKDIHRAFRAGWGQRAALTTTHPTR